MKSISENIFLKAPVFLQNTALALYGLKIRRIRYGGDYKKYFDQIKDQRQLSSSAINDFINTALKKMIRDAVENVPFYRELFKQNGFVPDDIKTVADLKKIPLLEKSLIRKDPLRFVHEKYDKKKLLCIHTTGTTGTPLNIFCDKQTRQRNYAFYDRFLSESGIVFRGKRATFGGRVIVPPQQKKPPFWRYSYFQKNMLFSSYHLTEENIPYYIEKLIKYKPDYIDSYPSSLYTIAKYAQKHNTNLAGITGGITTSAETLFQEHRELIESLFEVSVFDQYGAAEMCIFAGQCKEGNYHIHSDYGIVEFLKKDGREAKPGEEAELICTGFVNPIMPLIRYRIGDRGILSKKKCRCGSPFPVLDKILGRMDDVIVTPDGRKISRFGSVLYGLPIKELQYQQKAINSVTILIVKDKGFNKDTEDIIIDKIKKRFGEKIDLKISYLSSISRGPGGKLKTVVSYL